MLRVTLTLNQSIGGAQKTRRLLCPAPPDGCHKEEESIKRYCLCQSSSIVVPVGPFGSKQFACPDSFATAWIGLGSGTAWLAVGYLRSLRFIFGNRRNRAPLETMADRPPIRISHILAHNVRHGFLNCAQPSPPSNETSSRELRIPD